MELLPEDVELSPINPHGEPDGITGPDGQPWPGLDFVRPWDSLTEEEQRLFIRMAEVYAGFVSYTDDQIGRLVDYLEESGQLDNTIIVAVSDNGASGEGGPNGSFNENKFFNGVPDSIEENLAHLDELGSPSSYNHYNTGWAWAFDTPFPYWKRFAGLRGRDGGHVHRLLAGRDRGARRGPGPVRPRGRRGARPSTGSWASSRQSAEGLHADPDRGRELRCRADRRRRRRRRETQFYSMLGMRAIYHEGWLANTLHPPISGWSNFDKDEWELYNLREDRAQTRNVAARAPGAARRAQGPVVLLRGAVQGPSARRPRRPGDHQRARGPSRREPRDRYVYYPDTADVPESVAVNIRRRSYTIGRGRDDRLPRTPKACCSPTAAQRAATACTSRTDGCTTSTTGSVRTSSRSTSDAMSRRANTSSRPNSRRPATTSRPSSAPGTLTLYVDDEPVGKAEIMTQPGFFALAGDGLCVGRDSASPVSQDYEPPFAFSGGRSTGWWWT